MRLRFVDIAMMMGMTTIDRVYSRKFALRTPFCVEGIHRDQATVGSAMTRLVCWISVTTVTRRSQVQLRRYVVLITKKRSWPIVHMHSTGRADKAST